MSQHDKLDGDSRHTGRLDIRREELEDLSKEDLVDMLLHAEGRQSDATIKMRKPTVSRPLRGDLPWEAEHYIRLPASALQESNLSGKALWRVSLISFDLSHPVIGVEVWGDVVVGRSGEGVVADLDLSAYNATDYGISRQHAMLHPADGGLELSDLGSTNGTYCNRSPVKPEKPRLLEDKDIIAFGALQFQVRLEDLLE